MDIVLLIGVLVVALALALAFALTTAAKRADEELDREQAPFNLLAGFRSPSGKRFFADRQAVVELAETLEAAPPEPDDKRRAR